jgi:hypothetical protein
MKKSLGLTVYDSVNEGVEIFQENLSVSDSLNQFNVAEKSEYSIDGAVSKEI